jgi:hypothetical protein
MVRKIVILKIHSYSFGLRLYKTNKYSHKRIWPVGMIMYVRLKVLKKKKPKEYKLAKKYFLFLKKRTKVKSEDQRKKLMFNYFK